MWSRIRGAKLDQNVAGIRSSSGRDFAESHFGSQSQLCCGRVCCTERGMQEISYLASGTLDEWYQPKARREPAHYT